MNEQELVSLKAHLLENEADIAKMKQLIYCVAEYISILETYKTETERTTLSQQDEEEAYKEYFSNIYSEYF